jgi:CHAT domain-containing protein
VLVVGNIDYQQREEVLSKVSPVALGGLEDLRGSYQKEWSLLPGTGHECERIVAFHAEMHREGKRQYLHGAAATEERLKAGLPRHRYVHLATHGYFQPEGLPSLWEQAQAAAEHRGMIGEETRRLSGLLPGLLSGLVCAGANAPTPEGHDNGLLTAEEVAWLGLSRCELVVLSACETGLGTVRGGEGMMSLRRAFRQAGAKTVISSLWRVGDESTRELMESFYRRLWKEKQGKLQALRGAQLEMLAKHRREHQGKGLPFTWGAFVLDGEWR